MSGKSGTRLPGTAAATDGPVGERGGAQAHPVDGPVGAGAEPDPRRAARSLGAREGRDRRPPASPASGARDGPAGQAARGPRGASRSDSCASWARTWKRAATSPAEAVTTRDLQLAVRGVRLVAAQVGVDAARPGGDPEGAERRPRRAADDAGAVQPGMTPSERTSARTAAASSGPTASSVAGSAARPSAVEVGREPPGDDDAREVAVAGQRVVEPEQPLLERSPGARRPEWKPIPAQMLPRSPTWL